MIPYQTFSINDSKYCLNFRAIIKAGNKKENQMQKEKEEKQKKKKEKQKQRKKKNLKDKEDEQENNQKEETENKKQRQNQERIKEMMGYFRNLMQIKGDDEDQQQKKKEELDIFGFNQAEVQELKNYDDYNFGDIILQFPNPDHKTFKDANVAVTFQLAEQCFDEALSVISDEGFSKQQLKAEREAFLYSFLLLDDFKKQEDEDELIGHQSHKHKKKQKKKQEDKKKKETNYQIFENNVHLINEQQNEEQKNEDDIQFIKQKINEAQTQDDIDLWDDLMNVKLNDQNQFNQVQKTLYGGQFMYIKQYDDKDFEWICNNCRPKDFSTLIRFTLITKFCKNSNLHVRSFLSPDGQHIMMIIKCNEAIIEKEAEQTGLTKQLELGYCDLFSLEPVDKLYRQFRLKQVLREAVKQRQLNLNLENQKTIKFNLEKSQADKHSERIDLNKKYKQVYQEVFQWDEKEFWPELAKKQIIVDEWMEKIADKLGFDTSNEKTIIIDDDSTIKKEEWRLYYIYLCFLIDYGARIKRLLKFGENDTDEKMRRKNTNIIELNEGFLYRQIFLKALKIPNKLYHKKNGYFSDQNLLKNIWNRLGYQDPIPPFTDFFITQDQKEDRIWRRYETNQKKLRSKFNNMEKIKLTNSIVLKQINKILAYFPIHDPYQLEGISKEPHFQPLKSYQLLEDIEPTESEKKLKEFFANFDKTAEGADFDSESLATETQFNKKIPWALPIDTMRDYFGEKIALYFNFLSFYAFQLSYMSIGALVVQIIQNYVTDESIIIAVNNLFSIIIIIWSTLFIEFWKRKQVEFSIQFGQQDFEEDEAERPAFTGVFQRSIINDDLNEEYYSPVKRKMIMLFSVFISFTIIGIVVTLVFLIFQFKQQLIRCSKEGTCTFFIGNPLFNSNTVPAFLNSLQIGIFNAIYNIINNSLNNYENHKILSSYENSFIFKVFLFQFFNLFNSMFFMAFLSGYLPELQLCRFDPNPLVPENCFTQLTFQIRVIFLTDFVKNIPELLTPVINLLIKKKQLQGQTQEDNVVQHQFVKIDKFIMDEQSKDPYMFNEEIDGSVGDYMQLVIQFSFLTLFGLSFPLCFLLAFINCILQIQVDKMKLVNFTKRPLPAGASNIGTWLLILDVITFVSIFSNAGLIAYTSNAFKSGQIVVFSALLITFLATKYFLRFIIPDTPETGIIINNRHEFVINRIVKGLSNSSSTVYRPAKMNFKIAGVDYDKNMKKKSELLI